MYKGSFSPHLYQPLLPFVFLFIANLTKIILFHCDFDFLFLMTSYDESFFHAISDHLYIFLDKMSINIYYSFLN